MLSLSNAMSQSMAARIHFPSPLLVKWYFDLHLFSMLFAMLFRLIIYAPCDLKSHDRQAACEVHIAEQYRSIGTYTHIEYIIEYRGRLHQLCTSYNLLNTTKYLSNFSCFCCCCHFVSIFIYWPLSISFKYSFWMLFTYKNL